MHSQEARLSEGKTNDEPAGSEPAALRGQAPHKHALWSVTGSGQSRSAGGQPMSTAVSFDRHELRTILNLYGRKVAEGEWRDYAIDFLPEKAVFSIHRRTSEVPLYKIEKDPKLARKQGAYSVIATGGLILKRGHELERVIEVLDRKTKLVVV